MNYQLSLSMTKMRLHHGIARKLRIGLWLQTPFLNTGNEADQAAVRIVADSWDSARSKLPATAEIHPWDQQHHRRECCLQWRTLCWCFHPHSTGLIRMAPDHTWCWYCQSRLCAPKYAQWQNITWHFIAADNKDKKHNGESVNRPKMYQKTQPRLNAIELIERIQV